MIMDTNGIEKIMVRTGYGESELPARLLTISEVARFLGIHTSTVRRWAKKGLLKSYAIGLRHNLRFKQEDVLNFLDKCQEENAQEVSLKSDLDKVRYKTKSGRR
jgi:excisionase family DNA binding protein